MVSNQLVVHSYLCAMALHQYFEVISLWYREVWFTVSHRTAMQKIINLNLNRHKHLKFHMYFLLSVWCMEKVNGDKMCPTHQQSLKVKGDKMCPTHQQSLPKAPHSFALPLSERHELTITSTEEPYHKLHNLYFWPHKGRSSTCIFWRVNECLRTGRLRGLSSSPPRVKNF
jgi:hypothetical protein